MPLPQILFLAKLITTLPLSIRDVTNEIAVVTTALTGLALALLGLTYLVGVILKSVWIFSEWQKLGQALQVGALKGLLYIGAYGAISSAVAWIVYLLTLAAR